MTNQPDLRPVLIATQDWVATLVDGLTADHLGQPTPCAGWTIGDLVGHLLAVEHRIAVLPRQGNVDDEPTSLPLPDSGVAQALREGMRRAQQAWAEDAVLDTQMSPPWGTMPGRSVLGGYVQEHLVHGWDLASATGQDGEVMAGVAEQVLPLARQFVPAEIRSQDWVPFEAPVEPADDAGPTERLANWLGRPTR